MMGHKRRYSGLGGEQQRQQGIEINVLKRAYVYMFDNLCAMMNVLRICSTNDNIDEMKIDVIYDVGKQELGQGSDAVVKMCNHKETGRSFACKSINKSALHPDDMQDVRREIRMLKQLKGHPNIISLVDSFEDDNFFHIIMDLCEGGDLLNRIVKDERLSEMEAAHAFKAVLEAVEFCHAHGIVHRDVKPENLLLPTAQHDFTQLKLADFGAATHICPEQKLSDFAGTTGYIAPEVLDGCYDQRADVWSLGVLLYIMLSGFPPFDGDKDEDVFKATKNGVVDFDFHPWPAISEAAKDLIRSLLTTDPARRLTIEEVLQHPWLQLINVKPSNQLACKQCLVRKHLQAPPVIAPASKIF